MEVDSKNQGVEKALSKVLCPFNHWELRALTSSTLFLSPVAASQFIRLRMLTVVTGLPRACLTHSPLPWAQLSPWPNWPLVEAWLPKQRFHSESFAEALSGVHPFTLDPLVMLSPSRAPCLCEVSVGQSQITFPYEAHQMMGLCQCPNSALGGKKQQ